MPNRHFPSLLGTGWARTTGCADQRRRIPQELLIVAAFLLVFPAFAVEPKFDPSSFEFKPVREIRVPFRDLHLLLQRGSRRVMLNRDEYESLLQKAHKVEKTCPPTSAVLSAAEYEISVAEERAAISGTLSVDVLEEGLHALGLDFSGVGLMEATLDGQKAALGVADDGRVILFVEGRGWHRLHIEATTPVQTSAARQVLAFRVPICPATQLRLRVKGDVELRSGAVVAARTFDEAADETRFELLPIEGDLALVISLNSRLQRTERVVMARSLILDEVTPEAERLKVNVSLDILHRPIRDFRFAVPPGFEISAVESAKLSHWEIENAAGTQVLAVYLREETTDRVVITLSALRLKPELDNWTLSRIEPLEVVGHVAIVGLMLESRLVAHDARPQNMIPIDRSVLANALGEGSQPVGSEARRSRLFLAYYAPQTDYALHARFVRSAAVFDIRANMLLVALGKGLEIKGGFAVLPREEDLFEIVFTTAAGWEVQQVTDVNNVALPFERYPRQDGSTRIRVVFPRPIRSGNEFTFLVTADSTPPGWFEDWRESHFDFPWFIVEGALQHQGAIAVRAAEDLQLTPEDLNDLWPLDQSEKEKYGLAGETTLFAYRYDSPTYRARFAVVRAAPRLTAETYSFFRIEPTLVYARYELCYGISEGRVHEITFLLPTTTPRSLSVQGLRNTEVREYTCEEINGLRRWTVKLAAPQTHVARIAVDCQWPVAEKSLSDLALPVVRAGNVAYQSGMIAVEGNPELTIELPQHPRSVDIGELADAEYQPGPRLLGVFAFVGEYPCLSVKALRRPLYPLPPVVIEQVGLTTILSVAGIAQSSATYSLKSLWPSVEVKLPSGAVLWSAHVKGKPAKPQQSQQGFLLAVPANGEPAEVKIVYEHPVRCFAFGKRLFLTAPAFLVRHTDAAQAVEVPVVVMRWDVYAPTGFDVVSTGGTLSTTAIPPPAIAAVRFFECFYRLGGGIGRGLIRGCVARRAVSFGDKPEASANLAGKVAEGRSPKEGAASAKTQLGDDIARGREAEQKMPADSVAAFSPPAIAKPATHGVLTAVASLKIELARMGQGIGFSSLGVDPKLELTVISRRQLNALAWTLTLMLFAGGIALTCTTTRRKVRYVAAILVLSTLIPAIPGLALSALVLNHSFYAGCALAIYYLAARLVSGIALRIRCRILGSAAALTTSLFLFALIAPDRAAADPAAAAEPGQKYTVEVISPQAVPVPDDALVAPYDTDPARAPTVLIPQAEFERLWQLAHPAAESVKKAPPASYGLASAEWHSILREGDFLLLDGSVEITVFSDEYVEVPFSLEGAVITAAYIDGHPARLRYVSESVVPEAAQMVQAAKLHSSETTRSLVYLGITGKGRHVFRCSIRIHAEKQGGWRLVRSRIPATAATTFLLEVPATGTEVIFTGVPDRNSYKTETAGMVIRTALGMEGELNLMWRPRVGQGDLDRSLMIESAAVFDVREDGTRLVWCLNLQFRHGEHDSLVLEIPSGYHVEKVVGNNVRGWELVPAASSGDAESVRLRVDFLERAKEAEDFTVSMWREGPVPRTAEEEEIMVPIVHLSQAARHTGRLTIRHSPLLSVRTTSAAGAFRTDVAGQSTIAKLVTLAGESPLGIRPYEAYDFVTVPFRVKLLVKPLETEATAQVRSILRLAERERTLEARVEFSVTRRPAYVVRIAVPAELEVTSVAAQGEYEWTRDKQDDGQVLSVYFVEGQLGTIPVVVQGRLGRSTIMREVSLPRLRALDVKRQKGDIAVLTDPGFNVQGAGLENIEAVLIEQVLRWLRPDHQVFVRLALHYENPDYRGVLTLIAQEPDVSCITLTNVRVTDRSIDETVLLDFTIGEVGLREIEFLLPAQMADARISVPLLRQKIISPLTNEMVRVLLILQGAVTDQLKVLVERDRVLSSVEQAVKLPVVTTGRTHQRYVTIENASRDEITVIRAEGLEPLARQQKEWEVFTELTQGRNILAYAATPGAVKPALEFRVMERKAVETAGASIGLAQTLLIIDGTGTYRGRQTYHINNRTEQFLEIVLPHGAKLWTAQVAGEFVKPFVPEAEKPQRVCIPIVKTPTGDLDYEVVLIYGGQTVFPTWVGRAKLPVVTPLNIPVELSQLEARLPTTHKWLHFSGTMERVMGAEVFQVGILEYQSKVASSLLHALRFGDLFSQKRAAANLKKWRMNIENYQSSLQAAAGVDETVSTEISKVKQMLVESEVELQKAAASRGEYGGRIEDNRDRLERAFQNQAVNPAANAVLRREPNWKQEVVASSLPAGTTAVLNKAWLDEAGLAPSRPAARPDETRDKKEEKKGVEADQLQHKKQARFEAQAFDTPAMEGIFMRRKIVDRDGELGSRSRSQVARAEQYAENLDRRQRLVEIPPQAAFPAEALPETVTPPGSQLAASTEQPRVGRLRLTGLASLALELPGEDPERWESYRFRTPRGDVLVMGWTISRKGIALLKRVVVGLGFILASVLIRAPAYPQWHDCKPRHSMAAILIIVGVLCVLVGVLPIAAALAGIAGFIFLVRSRPQRTR